jgi:hypothetical protein
MIKRIAIHRFRGIREGLLDDLGKVNLLIGPNNSGKSAILELLYLGGTSGRPVNLILEDVPLKEGENVAFEATTSNRFDFLGLQPLPRVRKRHGYPENWEEAPITLTDEGGLEINLGAIEKNAPSSSFRFGSPLPEWGVKDKTRFYKEDIKQVALFSLTEQRGIPESLVPSLFSKSGIKSESSRWHYLWEPCWVHYWSRKEPIDYLTVWSEEGELPDSERVLFFDFHIANEHFQEKFAKNTYNTIPGWEKKISASLSKVFPELEGVEVNIKPSSWKDKWTGYIELPDQAPIEIDQFGDGARHAFKVLASLIALSETVDEKHPGLFLWEDPELFMHPATLEKLLDEVIQLISNRPIQIFITTQSLEVIAWLVESMENALSVNSDDIRTFALSLLNGILEVQPFFGKEISGWIEFIGDPRMIGQKELESPLIRVSRRREGNTEEW